MKKLLGITLAGIALSSAALAQDNLSLGPTAGFGHTWLSNNEQSNYQPAGNTGLTLVYSPMSHLGFGADLKWSIEGGKTSTNNTTTTTRLDYIRIPVKAIYFFGEYGQRLRPKLAAGPSVGFLVGGKQKTEVDQSGEKVVSEIKAKDFAKSVDFGLTAAAGFNYRLVERTWLNVDLNYYHGLTDVLEASNAEQKNRNIGINVGVTFGIGKVTPAK
jgi:hypothetical protein